MHLYAVAHFELRVNGEPAPGVVRGVQISNTLYANPFISDVKGDQCLVNWDMKSLVKSDTKPDTGKGKTYARAPQDHMQIACWTVREVPDDPDANNTV